ncbi:hypothetical protein V1508DRAFT_409840 [Lipomyces doorenjongii]|uniref:uncharacterized protein n=1 Tax=Lipomyces doorenjongii TaxID=383834 RepID=UPI0034CFA3A0
MRAQSNKKHSQVARHRTVDVQPMFGCRKKEGNCKNGERLKSGIPNKEAIDKMGKPWVSDIPYDIRDAAIDDLLKAYDSAHARYKRDNKLFKIKHRSRIKFHQETIVIHHKHGLMEEEICLFSQNEQR